MTAAIQAMIGMSRRMVLAGIVCFPTTLLAQTEIGNQDLREKALAVVGQAGRYFTEKLAVEGSYVYEYRSDLAVRRAEDVVGPTTGWVQPPGTPAVGAAFLKLYELTGDDIWLTEARKAADALLRTQLISGGWHNSMEFDPKARDSWCYRTNNVTPSECKRIDGNKARDRTLLDDDTTQSAIRFLIWLDKSLQGKDPAVRDGLLYALDRLLNAQMDNGAWPVVIDTSRPRLDAAIKFASLPEEWSRSWVKPSGGPYYILNDNLIRDTIHVLLLAEEHLGDRRYFEAAVHAGEFLLLAQLPAPQRGWAQIYDANMQPIWGRQFEPPSVASHETSGAMAALLELYGRTGDERFAAAVKEAAAWLKSVRLKDGNWSRFYELKTDSPLYVRKDGGLSSESTDLHRGYKFIAAWDIPDVLELAEAASTGNAAPPPSFWPSIADKYKEKRQLEAMVRAIIARRGKIPEGWVEDGWIRSGSFVDTVFLVAKYLTWPADKS
jgi:hypothetical protein